MEGDKWDDGCQFTCECLDAANGRYRCDEKSVCNSKERMCWGFVAVGFSLLLLFLLLFVCLFAECVCVCVACVRVCFDSCF